MKRLFLFLTIFFIAVFSASSRSQKKEFRIVDQAIPEENSYVMYIGDYDWGAGIDKFVIKAKNEIQAKKINPQDFEIDIYVKIKTVRLFPVKHKTPIACAAYLCDEHGNAVQEESGVYVAIEIDASEENEDTHPFNSSMLIDVEEIGNAHIENDELDIDIENCKAVVNKKAAAFEINSSTYKPSKKKEEIVLQYAYFLPQNTHNENAENKIPLIVWFHGIGEGGTNPYVPLMGQRAVNLATEKVQNHFENGAAVLVPLCPSGWMELSKTDRIGNRLWAPVDKSNEKCTSYYTAAVANLIEKFCEQNPQINKSRIYLGGASAGGFMVMNMLLEFPQKFAAGFAASEAYPDSNIPDWDIEVLAKTPLWLIVCSADKTVIPEKHTLATYQRLKAAGASNLHLTQYDSIKIGDHEFDAHCAWVHLLRDELTDGKLNLFDWLSSAK